MSNNEIKSDQFAEIRKKAEKILNNRDNNRLEDLKDMMVKEIKDVLYQLEVHQIELELQNKELRETQFKLEKARARYYELFDLAPIAYFTLSKEGIIKEANLTAANYLKETREELMQKKLTEYIKPEDQDTYYFFWKNLFASGNSQECELKMQKSEGKIFWAKLQAEVIQRDKEASSVFLTLENITKRKENERKLKKSKNLLQSLTNKTPGTVYQYQFFPDGSSSFTYATEGIYEIYEVTPEEAKEDATKVFDKLHSDDYEQVAASIKESAENLTIWEEEYRLELPNKGIRWVEGYAEPEKKADGSVLWHGNIRDITERKERERKLQEQQEEIEKLNDRLNENIEKGKMMHRQFLPDQLLEVKNLAFGTYYEPAERVGGDFYDLIEFEEEILFYISDVTGHDLSSAMLNIFLKETINSYLFHNQQKNKKDKLVPGSIIQHVNNRFHEESFPAEYFICLIVGTIDKRDFEVNFSNAGIQFLPLIFQKGGSVSSLFCTGMPVSAVSETFVYKNRSHILQPGDTLIMNTDGLFEQKDSKGNMYGEERLMKILSQNADLKPEKMVNKIHQDFTEFKGEMSIQDDLTSLLIQREFD